MRSRGIVSVKGKGPLELFYVSDGSAAVEKCLATVGSPRISSAGKLRSLGRGKSDSDNGQLLVRPRTKCLPGRTLVPRMFTTICLAAAVHGGAVEREVT